MVRYNDTKSILSGIMSMSGVIALVISLGTLPMLLLYKPSICPIRNICIFIAGATLFVISNYYLQRTPKSELIDTILRYGAVVFFMFIAGVASHIIHYGFYAPIVEVLILFVSCFVLSIIFVVYRSKKAKKIRKSFGI